MKKRLFIFITIIFITVTFLISCNKDDVIKNQKNNIKSREILDNENIKENSDLSFELGKKIFNDENIFEGYDVNLPTYPSKEIQSATLNLEDLFFKENSSRIYVDKSIQGCKDIIYNHDDYILLDSLEDEEFGSNPIYSYDGDYMLVWNFPKVVVKRLSRSIGKEIKDIEELTLSENSFIAPDIAVYRDGLVYSLIEPEIGKSTLNYIDFETKKITTYHEEEVRYTDSTKKFITGEIISAVAINYDNSIYFQVSTYENSPLYDNKPIKNKLYYWNSENYHKGLGNVVNIVEDDFPPMENIYSLNEGLLCAGKPFGEKNDQYLSYYKIEKDIELKPKIIDEVTIVDSMFPIGFVVCEINDDYLILDRDNNIYYFDEINMNYQVGNRDVVKDMVYLGHRRFLLNYNNENVFLFSRN